MKYRIKQSYGYVHYHGGKEIVTVYLVQRKMFGVWWKCRLRGWPAEFTDKSKAIEYMLSRMNGRR